MFEVYLQFVNIFLGGTQYLQVLSDGISLPSEEYLSSGHQMSYPIFGVSAYDDITAGLQKTDIVSGVALDQYCAFLFSDTRCMTRIAPYNDDAAM